MDFSNIKEELQYKLLYELIMQSPVLSGNMQYHIQLGYEDDYVIKIEAPFYDMKEFKKKGVIVHTGKSVNGVTDYANWVNEAGGFGSHNKSEHWVNRVINECCNIIAKKYGAIVEGELVG